MTTGAWALFGAAAVVAVVDWVAVTVRSRRVEYVAKPMATLLLLAVALAITPDDPTQRGWFVAALALSLAGDVFLMLPRDAFVPGLASFLLAHVAYIVGLAREADEATAWIVVPVAFAAAVGTRIVRAADRQLVAPVVAYMVVITAMACVAATTGDWRAFAGAVVFMASDSMIAWNRFVQPWRTARLAIMSTYHVAQALLVVSLLPR